MAKNTDTSMIESLMKNIPPPLRILVSILLLLTLSLSNLQIRNIAIDMFEQMGLGTGPIKEQRYLGVAYIFASQVSPDKVDYEGVQNGIATFRALNGWYPPHYPTEIALTNQDAKDPERALQKLKRLYEDDERPVRVFVFFSYEHLKYLANPIDNWCEELEKENRPVPWIIVTGTSVERSKLGGSHVLRFYPRLQDEVVALLDHAKTQGTKKVILIEGPQARSYFYSYSLCEKIESLASESFSEKGFSNISLQVIDDLPELLAVTNNDLPDSLTSLFLSGGDIEESDIVEKLISIGYAGRVLLTTHQGSEIKEKNSPSIAISIAQPRSVSNAELNKLFATMVMERGLASASKSTSPNMFKDSWINLFGDIEEKIGLEHLVGGDIYVPIEIWTP